MITKSKLRKLAKSVNSGKKNSDRKDIIYAYKLMCKEIVSRAKNGKFNYSFKQVGGWEKTINVAYRLFRLKHRDLHYEVNEVIDHLDYTIYYKISW